MKSARRFDLARDHNAKARMVGPDEVLEGRPDLADAWDEAVEGFSFRMTRSLFERMNIDDLADPVGVQFLPSPAELRSAPDDLDDPVGEDARCPVPWVVHKCAGSALLLLTRRCHAHCRYCFRRNSYGEQAADPTELELERALEYIEQSGVAEVVLSGGDPLAVHLPRLLSVLDRLADSMRTRRIHTRAPVTAPWSVTEELARQLGRRPGVWVVIHCNHPSELSPDVDGALERLVSAGVPVLNQSVLLRGVNDRPDLLAELSVQLVQRRVFPYYLHHTDRARGNAHLRVGLERGREIYGELGRRLSGLALPRYVLDSPAGSGKIDAMGPQATG